MREIVDMSSAGLRPFVLRAINQFAPVPGKFDAGKLINGAMRRTGLRDFGDDWSTEPLEKLVVEINSSARLSTIGAFIMKERLRGALVNRLRAVKLLKDHPEILEIEVAPILLVTGLQRTGTTYLQRLLAADPGNRSTMSWETLDPIPRGDRNERKKRIANARLSERALKWMSPGFFAIHPIEHLGPEEDVLMLDPTFYSTAPEAMMHVPEFGKWLEGLDHRVAYRWEYRMLQILQWQKPTDRWVLKSPHHLEHLGSFLNVFPGTTVIWTHRDPKECLASFLSMVYHGRAIFSNDVQTEDVRKHWLRKSGIMIQRAMKFRSDHPDVLIDLQFDQIVADPILAIESIYRSMGEDVSPKAEEGFNKIVQAHQRHRYGIHQYAADEFGLTDDMLEGTFDNYYTFLNQLNVSER